MSKVNLVGRERELAELADIEKSPLAELVVVYGRRRVGKTWLIRNYFSNKTGVYFEAIGIYQGTLKEQLTQFCKVISEVFYDSTAIEISESWMEAFELLTKCLGKQPKNKKLFIFIDEFPWMASPRSGIIKAFEYYWNRHWSTMPNLKLIICGSSAAWLIKKIIKHKGGLHNRVTHKIRLMPFSFKETRNYLLYKGVQLSKLQLLKLYFIVGGVPFYLNQIKKNLSVNENIINLFFDNEGMFFDEFEEVFSSLFKHHEEYKSLVKLIAKYHNGVARSELTKKNKELLGGRLSQKLEDLEYAGFISGYTPFQHEKKGKFYRITDEFSRFYLKWVDPIKSKLKIDKNTAYCKHLLHSHEYKLWQGYSFEIFCYKHLEEIKKALKIDDIATSSPWSRKAGTGFQGVQIDLLFERLDEAITLCEIKMRSEPYTITKEYGKKLLDKVAALEKNLKHKKQIFLVMVVPLGVVDNLTAADLISKVVTIDDFLK